MRKHLLLAVFLAAAVSGFGKGYRISLHIEGVSDSTVMLALYSGESKYAVDTAVLDAKGYALFSKSEPLQAGMYLVVLGRAGLFDFVVSDANNQSFSIHSNVSDYAGTLRFENSPENEALLAYTRRKSELTRRQEELNRRMQAKSSKEEAEQLEEEGRRIRREQSHFVDSLANAHKGSMLALVVNALNVPEPPDPEIERDNPAYDSLIFMSYYHFIKDHFFDRIDLTDERITRTPFFEPMLFYYFDRLLVYQESDSLNPYIDRVIEKSSANKEMFRYTLSKLFNHYAESKIMGLEGVVVHLAETYYLSGRTDWETDRFKASIEDFVKRNKPTLLGAVAPELRMELLGGGYTSLREVNAPFVILYFYEPSCSHCKSETPKMLDVFNRYKDKGVVVYAVYTQQNRDEWATYVAESKLDEWINVWDPQNTNSFRDTYNVYTTPQLYLLDKDKRIKARRVDAETLDKILGILTKKS